MEMLTEIEKYLAYKHIGSNKKRYDGVFTYIDYVNYMDFIKEHFKTLSDDEQQSLEQELYQNKRRFYEEDCQTPNLRCMSNYVDKYGKATSEEDLRKFLKHFNKNDSYLVYAGKAELGKILSLFLTTWSNDVRYRVTSVSSIVRAHFSKEHDAEDFEELCTELLIIKYPKSTMPHAYNELKVNSIIETRLDRGQRTIILSEIKAKEIEALELVKIVDYNSCLNTPESITKKNIEVLPDDF